VEGEFLKEDAWVMISALTCVVQQATSEGLVDGSSMSPSSRSVMLATMQQLHKSGLLQQLPSFLSAMTAGLTVAHSAMPDASPSEADHTLLPSYLVVILMGLKSMTDLLRNSSATQQQQQQWDPYGFWSCSHALAVTDYVLALARHISSTIGPTGRPEPGDVLALATACDCMEELCVFSLNPLPPVPTGVPQDAQLDPAQQQVLMSPSLMPSIALVLAAVAYTWPAEQQRRRNAQTVSSSTAGCSGRNSQSNYYSSAAVQLAWQQADRRAASLPASHLQL
jgi:hypothetical protein